MPTNHDETLLERYTREAEIDARMMAKAEIVKVPRELLEKVSSLWVVGLDMDNEIKTLRAILAQPVADEHGEQQPVAWQARFIEEGNDGWGACALEHHEMVKANPREWPGYETRELYAPTNAQTAPLCNHRFMYFGDQKKRRCADCCVVEGNELSAPQPEQTGHQEKRCCEYAGCCAFAHPSTSLCLAHHSPKNRAALSAQGDDT